MTITHECVFVEEQEPNGRLILPPCIVCGVSAMDALGRLHEHLEALETRGELHLNEIGRRIREREDLGDLLGELAYEGRIKGHGDPLAELHDPTGTLARLNEALGIDDDEWEARAQLRYRDDDETLREIGKRLHEARSLLNTQHPDRLILGNPSAVDEAFEEITLAVRLIESTLGKVTL